MSPVFIYSVFLYQFPQHSMENATVAIIIHFHIRVQLGNGFELNHGVIWFRGFHAYHRLWRHRIA